MNTSGNVKWQSFKRQWKEEHRATKGYYACHICTLPVHQSVVSLDHLIDSSKRPDLAYKDFNIRPSHIACNEMKGQVEWFIRNVFPKL